MNEDMDFREMLWKLISVYELTPEAAGLLLLRILDALASGTSVPYLGFEEE